MSLTTFTADEAKAIEDKYTLPRMVCLPAGAIGLYFLTRPWPADHPVVIAAWTIFTAYFLFCWTSCFHETAHQTLSGSKSFSVWLGRFLGTAMFVPYTVYRESHIRHHAYLNKPNDWELWPYSDPRCSLTFRRVFVWFDLLLGVAFSPFIYGRIYFHKDSPLKSQAARRTVRNEYLFIVVFWAAVMGLVGYFNVWGEFLRIWALPYYIAGLFQTGRKFTEHLGMPSYDPMLGTRTVLGPNWLTRLGTFVNFDIFIHGPHHRHPRVAHNLLGQKMQEYIDEHPDVNYPIYRSYWRATLAMLPHFFRNPGCGMNAGAPAPGKARLDDVQDFVGDVTTEVVAVSDAVVMRTAGSV